jgi:hypothetical protein
LYRYGIRTPVPWLRNAAGDLDGLRLRAPSPRVRSAVDGPDDDVLLGYAEVHDVRKPIEDGAPLFFSHEPKLHRIVGQPIPLSFPRS